ncbi:MAG: hypothetical protein HY865_14585 [Chloroflexi bacterium]|nr:hypothetical protein [Chloroflexota bacterium]
MSPNLGVGVGRSGYFLVCQDRAARATFRDTAGLAGGRVGDHNCFFAQLALGATFGSFGNRQRRQVDVYPQPILGEIVAQGQTLAAKQAITAPPQLRDLLTFKRIQRAG